MIKIRSVIPATMFILLTYIPVTSAHGDHVFGSVMGSVTSISETGIGDAPDDVVIGSDVNISFSYDPNATPDSVTSTYAGYGTGIHKNVEMTIGSNIWSISIVDSDPNDVLSLTKNGSLDAFRTYVYNWGSTSTINSFPDYLAQGRMWMNVWSSSSGFLSDFDLPRSEDDIDISAITGGNGYINTWSNGAEFNEYIINFNLNPATFQLSSIPEPSAGFLVGGIFSLVGLRRRRPLK